MMHTIEVSEDVFRHLHAQARRLNLSPDELIAALLRRPESPLIGDGDVSPLPSAGSVEALAAVDRLANLFADMPIPHLDQVLADPMLALANVDLDERPR